MEVELRPSQHPRLSSSAKYTSLSIVLLLLVAKNVSITTDVSGQNVEGPSIPTAKTRSTTRLLTVSELTRSHIANITCPEPLVPFYDRIVDPIPNDSQLIPRTFHFAWIRGYDSPHSRCISQDMIELLEAWIEKFPSYNFYFHDDVAVDTLFQQDWSEFPQLTKIMNACVKFKSAMRIDIWRALILYKYGGVYSDIDNYPGVKLSERSIEANFSALFLSDTWNRPSQWFQAMESKSPFAYFTMIAILRNLQDMEDVSRPRLVWTTGPEALKFGYLNSVDGNSEDAKKAVGEHKCKYCKGIVKKLPSHGYLAQKLHDLVFYPRNQSEIKIKVKERIEIEMKTMHWKAFLQSSANGVSNESCLNLLFKNDVHLTGL